MAKNSLKQIMLVAALVTLSACTSTFRSDVATFHTLPEPKGERLMIVPMDTSRKDSLEFQQYAAVLANHLRNEGYQATGEKDPELIIGFDVTVNDGREKIRSIPGHSRPYYWRSYWHWGRYWGPITPFDHMYNDELITRTVYTATLIMEVRTPEGELLFEGRAETETRTKAVPEVVPLLAEALFENFPGESGVTRHVRIDLENSGR